MGIGPKVTDGRLTKRLSIRFYVERKVAKGAVPKKDRLPAKIDGVPTDVTQSARLFGSAEAQEGMRAFLEKRPAPWAR